MGDSTIVVADRFCGPPQSGNGGYVGGRLAEFVDSAAVAVRLYRSPPLEKTLTIRREAGGATLLDEGQPVAEARPTQLDLVAPAAPSFEEAERASRAFRGFREHVFPKCFVCGPERGPGDGLRIFPGAHAEGELFAAPWIPDASLLADDDQARTSRRVAKEFLWAALDCPGAFSFPQPEGKVVLLGEMKVALSGDVAVGERCVLASWQVAAEGRKHSTGSAIYGADGDCRGVALGLWFEVEPASVPVPEP